MAAMPRCRAASRRGEVHRNADRLHHGDAGLHYGDERLQNAVAELRYGEGTLQPVSCIDIFVNAK